MIESPAYEGLTDGEKEKAVEKAYDYANQLAGKSLDSRYELDKAVQNARDAEKQGIRLGDFVALQSAAANIEGDKDKNRKTISGSKREKVLDVISAMDLTKEQKDLLYIQNGYAEKKLKNAPWNKKVFVLPFAK